MLSKHSEWATREEQVKLENSKERERGVKREKRKQGSICKECWKKYAVSNERGRVAEKEGEIDSQSRGKLRDYFQMKSNTSRAALL